MKFEAHPEWTGTSAKSTPNENSELIIDGISQVFRYELETIDLISAYTSLNNKIEVSLPKIQDDHLPLHLKQTVRKHHVLTIKLQI